MSDKIKISVVIPVYGCKDCLTGLSKRLKTSLETITPDYEIIMVNDASPDDPWETIKSLSKNDNRIKGINLSRNFGQHYAIFAGLNHCKGEMVVVMDCDLQDRPEEIIKLYDEYIKGYDLVVGSKDNRNDKFIKKAFSKCFYYVLSYLTETEQDNSVGNFGLYSKKVIDSVLQMNDYIKYFPTMIKWVGFKKSIVKIEHSRRELGKTSYNFKNLVKLALNTILSFSDKPLTLVIKLGLSVAFVSLALGLYNLVQYFTGNIKVTGWASLIISIWFLSGIIIFVLGIVGLYIGRIFEKVKERPLYIVKDKMNIDEDN